MTLEGARVMLVDGGMALVSAGVTLVGGFASVSVIPAKAGIHRGYGVGSDGVGGTFPAVSVVPACVRGNVQATREAGGSMRGIRMNARRPASDDAGRR